MFLSGFCDFWQVSASSGAFPVLWGGLQPGQALGLLGTCTMRGRIKPRKPRRGESRARVLVPAGCPPDPRPRGPGQAWGYLAGGILAEDHPHGLTSPSPLQRARGKTHQQVFITLPQSKR